ncbi:MAG: TolC family outer membrane protein [Betaproteobacteria bacterium]|nr:TolC family outer membrane protein [Betaproteobacteria bacterium]
MRKAKIVVALIALFGAGTSTAADLVSIYREAAVSDAQFASARAAYLAGQERAVQGKSGLLPQLTANAALNYTNLDAHFIGGNQFAGGQRDFGGRSYGVQLTQPLYRPQNWETYEQGKLQAQVAEIQLSAAAQDLMVRVSQAYFDVLLAQENLTFIRAQKSAIAEQLAQAKRNFIVGTATITDTNDAQARYDLATAQEVAALNDLEVRNRALAAIIGKNAGGLAAPMEPIVLTAPDPVDMNAWVGQAQTTSLQVEIQRANVAIASREVKKQRGGHMPTLDAVANYTDTRANASTFGFGSEVKQTVIGVQLNVPLYLGGLVTSRIRESTANQTRAEKDLEQARRTAILNTQQAYLGVTSGLAQGKALEQALQSSLVSLESTKLGRDVGVRTSVDVLNAQQQVANARRDLARARYDTIVAQLKLKQAVGRLTMDDLEAVNRLLKTEGR